MNRFIEKNENYNLGVDYINVKTSNIVTVNEQIDIFTQSGPVELMMTITSDFSKIDPKYHEICMNVITAKYINKVSFGDNPFSQCKPVVKRRWWQFWKSEYFSL